MCSVSASPVMKMTGTLLKPASRFSRRQVSKPSMPGIMASSRTISGVICSTMRNAAAPSIATMTVIPAPSSASVRRRNVSGESSTTSAMSRFFDSAIMALQALQGCHVPVQIESVDERPHFRNEIPMLGIIGADLVELDLDRADITKLSQTDQFFDMVCRRLQAVTWLPLHRRHLLIVILPLELEELSDQFEQARNIDRLHQVAVVKGLRQRGAMRFQGAGRNHQDTCLVMAVYAKRFRDRPAAHACHRDIQQKQTRTAVLGERKTTRTIGCGEQDKAERRQHLAQQIALDRIVVGDQDGFARPVIAGRYCVDGGDLLRIGHFRQQQLDAERTAAADLAGHLNIAAHDTGKQPANGQPQSGSGLRLRDAECAAFEGSKDAFKV